MKLLKRFAAFDIETVKPLPPDSDWRDHRPLGVSSACLRTEDGDIFTWYNSLYDQDTGNYIPVQGAMVSNLVVEILEHMATFMKLGYTLVSWNGLGFDLPVLGEEAKNDELARAIALAHCDPMFQFYCIKGYPVGLDTAAKGMGLPGKTEGMHGDLAPLMWQDDPQGLIDAGYPELAEMTPLERRNKVLEYLVQDVKTTLDVARAVQDARILRWTSRKGRPNTCPFPTGLWSVSESLWIPEPDTSWMTNPIKRTYYTDWLFNKAPEVD